MVEWRRAASGKARSNATGSHPGLAGSCDSCIGGAGGVDGGVRGFERADGRCVDPAVADGVPVWAAGARGSSVIMLTAGIEDAGGTLRPLGAPPPGAGRKLGDDPKTGATTAGP
jgi:hypothetical protein